MICQTWCHFFDLEEWRNYGNFRAIMAYLPCHFCTDLALLAEQSVDLDVLAASIG